MTKSNKPIVWSLFAAGGTLAALLAPVLALLLLSTALGHPPAGLGYESMRTFAMHGAGRFLLFSVISLFLWHAAHRLRITLFDLGVRADKAMAALLYLAAAAGTIAAWAYLARL